MTDAKDPKLALFELYLATAEKVSDHRTRANTWMLSVNSAIVALYGSLKADKMAVGTAQKAVLTSYRDLNQAKFTVLQQIEAKLPVAPFTRERETYRRDRRRSLLDIERLIPGCFALLYAVMLVAAVVTRGS